MTLFKCGSQRKLTHTKLPVTTFRIVCLVFEYARDIYKEQETKAIKAQKIAVYCKKLGPSFQIVQIRPPDTHLHIYNVDCRNVALNSKCRRKKAFFSYSLSLSLSLCPLKTMHSISKCVFGRAYRIRKILCGNRRQWSGQRIQSTLFCYCCCLVLLCASCHAFQTAEKL